MAMGRGGDEFCLPHPLLPYTYPTHLNGDEKLNLIPVPNGFRKTQWDKNMVKGKRVQNTFMSPPHKDNHL
ncbi:hypothetical protein MTR_4g079370 [Medicago truncatula]|uniref:Uncharacterized protein n=1 Tax=Medicago truncatula TaxID=3880 RepID=G7JUZ8_MEDTR|nr:hypothetical protein MTR_4g079370 [Medicago truncatula]